MDLETRVKQMEDRVKQIEDRVKRLDPPKTNISSRPADYGHEMFLPYHYTER